MNEVRIEALRETSRAAFGQTYRLEVMLEIAKDPDGLVTQTTIAQSLGISVSNVQAPVKSLIACGLLTELPRVDSRSRFLTMNSSVAWEWALELAGLARDSSKLI